MALSAICRPTLLFIDRARSSMLAVLQPLSVLAGDLRAHVGVLEGVTAAVVVVDTNTARNGIASASRAKWLTTALLAEAVVIFRRFLLSCSW